ncbi:fimbrial protein [Parabacteroides chongii]|uniref:fimbrial protein n=1 Tax=Parabacteroides chongii TaxID=2685834 RepID=UPI00240E4D3A|nr:fimbrial protein [Parabacteroides chongii]WFE86720.1 FimB/Mfa2 family fimbrial subunit [Parabacteroides chongii]
MKFYSSFLTILSALVLCISCSEHDVIEENTEPEIVYDATFSLSVNHTEKAKTKSKEVGKVESNNYMFIKSLSLAVFQGGKLVAFSEEEDGENGVYRIEEVAVPSGNVKVVLLANVKVGEQYKKLNNTKLSDYEEMTVSLDDEINGSLSMSSGFLDYSFNPGYNFVGYGSKGEEVTVDHSGVSVSGVELSGEKIKMVRNVSRVELAVVYLKPNSEYLGEGNVTFTIKDFFVANVKSKSKLIFDKGASVECETSDLWCGNFPTGTGSLEPNTKKNFLFYDVTNPPLNHTLMNELYPFVNNDIIVCSGNIFGLDENNKNVVSQTINYDPKADSKEPPHIGYSAGFPLGTYFHIYENKDLGTNRTLFVVKGDYTYNPVKGQMKVWKDRYYTVVVNKDNKKSDHEYIKHNYLYDISLTIAGPGSENPFDPESTADISVAIDVKDWDVVDQNESLD